MGYISKQGVGKTRILIVNDTHDCGAEYAPLFRDRGEIYEDPNALKLNPFAFKLIVFTGGSDVTPGLYGDTSPHGICHYNLERDRAEKNIFGFGQQRGIKMVGICRGMQFLNVMTGGKLMHDIGGHGHSNHLVMTKDGTNEPFLTNSYHHQMCIPHKSTHLLAWSHTKLSKHYIGNEDKPINYSGPEVEAIYMPWLKGVGVQWHPEAAPKDGAWADGKAWFDHLVRDLLYKDVATFKNIYLGLEGAKMNIVEV